VQTLCLLIKHALQAIRSGLVTGQRQEMPRWRLVRQRLASNALTRATTSNQTLCEFAKELSDFFCLFKQCKLSLMTSKAVKEW
jgi:hypothetical protein